MYSNRDRDICPGRLASAAGKGAYVCDPRARCVIARRNRHAERDSPRRAVHNDERLCACYWSERGRHFARRTIVAKLTEISRARRRMRAGVKGEAPRTVPPLLFIPGRGPTSAAQRRSKNRRNTFSEAMAQWFAGNFELRLDLCDQNTDPAPDIVSQITLLRARALLRHRTTLSKSRAQTSAPFARRA
ncbi:MAG: hypothetical protein JWM87_534 [Candidatus Eremiobacteraeota bacterium]|nr:hypothetical protein [Candidatus Eremiobacteraeota bacterium]